MDRTPEIKRRTSRPAVVEGDVAVIPLAGGKIAIVDEEFQWIGNYSWSLNNYGYAKTRYKGKTYLMHKVIMPGSTVDHKDRNKLNNRKSNLRYATQQQNIANIGTRADNRSGYRGVSPHNGKYRSLITNNGKRIDLGIYDTPEDAARVYIKKARELWGEFAYA